MFSWRSQNTKNKLMLQSNNFCKTNSNPRVIMFSLILQYKLQDFHELPKDCFFGAKKIDNNY